MFKACLLVAVLLTSFAGIASCFQTKQCCKRDFQGNLQCIQRCSFDVCPYNYPQELK